MDKTAFNNAYQECRKYWHLACSYDRLNPRSADQLAFTENNPHLNNYRKALVKMKGTV